MSQVTLIKKLQQLDDAIRAEKIKLTRIMRQMNEPAAITETRAVKQQSAEKMAQFQRIQRDLELQHGTLTSKYDASHGRMYSGKVTNSRELADLEREVSSLAQRRSKLEDEMLENMMELEEATEAFEAAEATLTTLENDWAIDHADLDEQKMQAATMVGKLMAQRKAHAAKIELKYLRQYIAIAQRRKGNAVVALERDQCSGCRTKVSSATVKSVAEGHITYCGNCGRILC